MIADLRRQRTEIVRNQAEIVTRYGVEHPEYLKAQHQLEQLDLQIRTESQRIIRTLDATARAAEMRIVSLRDAVAGLTNQQNINMRAVVQADSLQRDADAKRLIYNQLAQAAQQQLQAQHIDHGHGYVIDTAIEPRKPSFPNIPLFSVIGLLLGTLIASVTITLLQLADTGIRDTANLEIELGTSLLGNIPRITRRQLRAHGQRVNAWDYVSVKPMSAYAEAVREVRSALFLHKQRVSPKIIAITSALRSEGKTTCSVSLARVTAMTGTRTVLVDCDLRQCQLTKLAGQLPAGGLLEVLNGEIKLEQALIRDSTPGLDVLPLMKASFNPNIHLTGGQFGRLIAELASQYGLVILDCPPILAVADARALALLADKVVLVTRWAKTPAQSIIASLERLRRDGADVAGIVLSLVDSRHVRAAGPGNMIYHQSHHRSYYIE